MTGSETTIAFLAVEGCLASSARTAGEIVAYANFGGGEGRLNLIVASVDGRPVRAFGGDLIEASRSFAELSRPAAALLPVVLGPLDPLLADGRVLAAIRALGAAGSVIAATCDAAFLVAAAGLLDGFSVPVHPGLRQDFRRRFPAVRVDEGAMRFSRDGILLSVGSGSFVDLMVETLRVAAAPAVADRCGRVFLDRAGAPGPLVSVGAEAAADPAAAAAALIETRYSERIDLARLAEEVGTGERTLLRRFSLAYGFTPAAYLRARRCAAAASLLSTTGLAVEEIAWKVGYTDASAFARAFRAYSGVSPARYRAAAR